MASLESWTYSRRSYESAYRAANRDKIREIKRRYREKKKKERENQTPK